MVDVELNPVAMGIKILDGMKNLAKSKQRGYRIASRFDDGPTFRIVCGALRERAVIEV